MFTLPETVTSILARLESAGHAAYAVGGAVRDLIRSVPPHDFDLTTSARPEEVMALFANETVIPTGLQHGTVTLVIDHTPYEITTFRGESGYADHRRPDAVCFLDSIEDDLARRDFTAGAIAYSPTRGLCDPFDGVADVKAGVLRAVGDPMTRFSEDGLRVLRALRFASACGFTIEAQTARALHEGKHLIAPVAAERIYNELTRTLCGANIEQVLLTYGDVLAVAIPELTPLFGFPQNTSYHDRDVWAHTAATVAAIAPEPVLRWTMLLHDIAKPACHYTDARGTSHFKTHPEKGAPIAEAILTRLKAERATREEVTVLIRLHDIDLPKERADIHRLLVRLGKERTLRLLAVKESDLSGKSPYGRTHGRDVILPEVKETVEFLLAEGAPLTVRDLAVDGSDLLSLGLRGREVGDTLSRLLEAVIDGTPNRREALLGLIDG
ncbi:MAG: HD domain-containing protein [Clostridia bacterium]|nr:HD domain-containing protein [Clostridia bacterium]